MRKVSTIFALLLVSVVTVSFAQEGVHDWSTYDFTQHFTLKNGGGKKLFEENKRIFIADFQINQVVMANGKQVGSSNLAKMSVGMTPIDMNAYQDVVTKLYNQLLEQLKGEGYTIVSDEEVANSDYARKEHNGRSIFCQYVTEPSFGKDQNGNQMAYVCPKNKFIVFNTSAILGNWYTKFAKSINANVLTIILNITPVTFDGSKRSGYKKGPSIEAEANLVASPYCLASNERGGFGVWATPAGGNAQWVGSKGMYETNSSTDVFGGVRGKYVLDVNQDAFLAEVEALAGGFSKGYVQAILKEIK